MRLFGRELVGGKGLEVRAEAEKEGPAEILLYDTIGKWRDFWTGEEGGISAEDVVRTVAELRGREISVRLNSRGGIVADGVAIYNALRRHDAKVRTANDGMAYSIASLILMAGDEREIAQNASTMIHSASTVVGGNSRDLRKMAEVLDRLDESLLVTYATRALQPEEQVKAWMLEDTYMTAKEALARGLATRIVDGRTEVASQPKAELARPPVPSLRDLEVVAIDGVDLERRRSLQATQRARARALQLETGQ